MLTPANQHELSTTPVGVNLQFLPCIHNIKRNQFLKYVFLHYNLLHCNTSANVVLLQIQYGQD